MAARLLHHPLRRTHHRTHHSPRQNDRQEGEDEKSAQGERLRRQQEASALQEKVNTQG